MQDWHCLEVGKWQVHDCDAGYRMFFSSGNRTMQYGWLLRARFVMVRVGPESVYFWVEDKKGVPGGLTKTGRMHPANPFRPDRSKEGSSSLKELSVRGQIIWI